MTTKRRFGLLQATIVLAALMTALIHIWLAFQFASGVDSVFILNGLGYLGLTALLFLPLPPGSRNLIRCGGVAVYRRAFASRLFSKGGRVAADRQPVA